MVIVVSDVEKPSEPRGIVFLVRESAEGGYEAQAVGWSIFTEAETLEELKERVRDAVLCHFEDAASRPKFAYLHIIRDEVVVV